MVGNLLRILTWIIVILAGVWAIFGIFLLIGNAVPMVRAFLPENATSGVPAFLDTWVNLTTGPVGESFLPKTGAGISAFFNFLIDTGVPFVRFLLSPVGWVVLALLIFVMSKTGLWSTLKLGQEGINAVLSKSLFWIIPLTIFAFVLNYYVRSRGGLTALPVILLPIAELVTVAVFIGFVLTWLINWSKNFIASLIYGGVLLLGGLFLWDAAHSSYGSNLGIFSRFPAIENMTRSFGQRIDPTTWFVFLFGVGVVLFILRAPNIDLGRFKKKKGAEGANAGAKK